jgi:hypothetical protein
MTKQAPPSDWVAYGVVLTTVIAMMFGKYLIARGDKDEKVTTNDKPKDNR